jgi:hypothetical protein
VASLAAAKVGAVVIPLTESPSRDQLKYGYLMFALNKIFCPLLVLTVFFFFV